MDSSWEGMINYLKNHAQFNEFNQPVAMNSAQQEIGRKSEFTYNKNGQSFEIKFNNEKTNENDKHTTQVVLASHLP
ncbi:hypothetical protein [Serratia fonticola]|uniref:hypothetical protein n=1 Tax=Serratia fonticola TaxID=47917 RepID=UPI00046727D9|nr:hypothetical protein [Serratia fonticola]